MQQWRGWVRDACRALLLASACFDAGAADAPAPGGAGVLRSSLGSGVSFFYPQSETVRAIEVKYEIGWKLWSLMGEPIGNYHLSWQLQSVRLKVPSAPGSVQTYWPQTLPPPLRKAAAEIELYLDGHAEVATGTDAAIRHRFNTGVAVRAGGERSYNVPGGYQWDQLFSRDPTFACNDGKTNPPSYLSGAEAKQRFIKGIVLTDFRPCAASGVSNLASLEVEISRLCRAEGAKYPFCPKVQTEARASAAATSAIDDAFAKLDEAPSKRATAADASTHKRSGDAIDDAFARVEATLAENERQRLAQEALERLRATRRPAFASQCAAQIGEKTSCDERRCGPEPRKELIRQGECRERQVERNPNRPPGNYLHIPIRDCDEIKSPNPAYPQWQSCSVALKHECESAALAQRRVETCIAERQAGQEALDAAAQKDKASPKGRNRAGGRG